MSNSLKILIPVLSYGRAGGMRVLSELANNWLAMGLDVTFVSHYESDYPYFPVNVKMIWINDNGNEINRNSSIFAEKNSGFKRMFALLKYLKKNSDKYDIVLANHNLSAWSVWFGSKKVNFYYIQAYEVEFSVQKGVKGVFKRFGAYLTYYLPLKRVVNADIYKNYKNLHANYVIPPGLDLDIYYPKEAEYKNKKEIIVGCIGRKEEWKGSEDVAEAVKMLHSKGYDVKFKVAFNPVKYERHELVHPDGDKNLADFYRSLDILVAPGHIQLGAVHYPVIEAMACNVPVITTGYYPANNENSFIVPVKSPDKIAETIEMIINDYSIAIKKAEKAREYVQQFDWKIVSKKFIDIFQETIAKNKKGNYK